MKFLTPQEQNALIVILGLLLVGMAVQTWRTAHPLDLPKKAAAAAVESK